MRLTASPAGVDAGFWSRMGVKKAAFATRQYGFDQFIVGLLIALLGIGIMVGGFLMDRGSVVDFPKTGWRRWGAC